MTTERQQLLGDAPPPRRRFPARRLRFSPVLVSGGIVFAIILLVVVMNISSTPGVSENESTLATGVTELITPDQLDESDLTDGSTLDARTSSVVDLPQGGWIQTTKENGEPAQQYRFTKLDPTPEGYGAGWLLMQKPQADFFLSRNRIVSMTGDSALAFAPGRTLTEGTLTGNVVIRMFESIDGRIPDPRRDPPTLEVRTQEATFDNFSGEILCAGKVDIQTAAVHIPGEGLRLRMNDRVGRIESLTMQKVDTIRLIAPEKTTTVARAHSPAIPRVILARHRQNGHSNPSATSRDPQFYVLTLHHDIRIVQGDEHSGRTATGNKMSIVFSLEGSSAQSSISERKSVDTNFPIQLTSTLAPRPLLHSLATLAIASFDDDAGLFHPTADDLITTIHCSGGLDMIPSESDADRLDSPDDLRLTLTGAPVVLHDRGEEFRGECGQAVFHGLEESVHLIASAAHAVVIDSPELEGGGEHFFYSKAMHRAGFRHAGWLNAGTQSPDGPVENDDPLEKLHITWTEGVDFAFSESPSNTDSPGSDAKPILNSAEFRGEVKVTSDRGAIEGDLIHLDMGVDNAGKSIPKSMIVQGNVKASDPDITVWADDLEIAFIIADRGATPSPDHGDNASIFGGKMDIDTLTATGDVQTLISDGSRAFADRIHGEASTQTIEFTGDNVVFVSDRLLLDRGKHYILRKADGVFHGEGPGQARIFSEAIRVDDDRRIPRPWTDHPAPKPEVQARWNRSMNYDHTFNNEAGKIDLEGKVVAVSQPSPLQLDSLKGEAVSLEFVLAKADSSQGDAEKSLSPVASPAINGDRKERRLSQMVATGEAHMESRVWATEDHSDPPRIFSIAAPYIEFDNLSEAALAKGKGEMLIRNPNPQRDRDSSNKNESSPVPFSSSGTSLFRWSEKLEMTPGLGDTSAISFRGEVRAIHKSGEGETAIITGEQLDATIARVTPPEATESPAKTQKPEVGDHLSFGGPRQIRKLFGQGAIFIRTPTREVLCDRFEYNLITEIAEMSAKGSGRVTIKTVGSPDLTQAGRVYWDMARDSITIERATGGGK